MPSTVYAHSKDRPQHREPRALLFLNSAWVLLRLAELWIVSIPDVLRECLCKSGAADFAGDTDLRSFLVCCKTFMYLY